jgi:hypothetical protein
MSWRNIITEWLSKEGFVTPDSQRFSTTNLVEILVEKNIIPQVANGVFTYRVSAKEMLMWSIGSQNQKEIEALEKETGVSLEHYHRLNTNKFETLLF